MKKTILKMSFKMLMLVVALFGVQLIVESYIESTSDYEEMVYCPVMGIELYGDVTTYGTNLDENGGEILSTSADDVVWAIEDADLDPNVSAILLEVDSYGGSGVAGDEIATALKVAEKPTVALIRDGAASAAYWAATGADYIIASPISDVGSIGVTGSYLDYTKQNQNDGLTFIELNSGKFKDTGNPDKPLTLEERALWQRDLDIMHQYFVEQVAANRGLEIDKVKELADGSTVMGQMALDNGLIDKLGSRTDAMQYFINQGAIEYEDLCWY
ncbi:S49 family peptidase [Candidatus Parcubacteria bacterium]|jgi:protease IV|nr:S49 family peptidase [Candidatus Parcubacteria bacterium]